METNDLQLFGKTTVFKLEIYNIATTNAAINLQEQTFNLKFDHICTSNVITFPSQAADISYAINPTAQESQPMSAPTYTDSIADCSTETLKYQDGAGTWTPVAIGVPSFIKTYDSAS